MPEVRIFSKGFSWTFDALEVARVFGLKLSDVNDEGFKQDTDQTELDAWCTDALEHFKNKSRKLYCGKHKGGVMGVPD